jgi:uncharacterized protein YggE
MELDYKKYAWMAGALALICLAFASVTSGLSDLDGMKHPNGQVASITVSGEGEMTAIPDVAMITFTVRETAKTSPEAQKAAEAKVTKALDAIYKLGVDKKDVKTVSYNISPKYETQGGYCTGYTCPPTKTVVVGQEVSETISVKVRKTDTTGEVLGAIGAANITEMTGPEYTVDDKTKIEADAKALAIKDAKVKAQATADALGVSLGAITQFSENNGGYYPVMYRADAVSMKAAGAVAPEAVSVPVGENIIKSSVSITYSLK